MIAALRTLHHAYSHRPVGVRAHTLGRFLSCPFLAVVDRIPGGSTLLDIGGGHGILACLALAAGAGRVVVVEPDVRKALPSLRQDRLSFVAGFDDCVAGSFDVVTIVDVLYKVPLREWDAVLARVLQRLTPGGLFLLKEIDPVERVKGLLNREQERLASAIGLTLGEAFSYETQDEVCARLERLGFIDFSATKLGRFYPHAHILYAARRPH